MFDPNESELFLVADNEAQLPLRFMLPSCMRDTSFTQRTERGSVSRSFPCCPLIRNIRSRPYLSCCCGSATRSNVKGGDASETPDAAGNSECLGSQSRAPVATSAAVRPAQHRGHRGRSASQPTDFIDGFVSRLGLLHLGKGRGLTFAGVAESRKRPRGVPQQFRKFFSDKERGSATRSNVNREDTSETPEAVGNSECCGSQSRAPVANIRYCPTSATSWSSRN